MGGRSPAPCLPPVQRAGGTHFPNFSHLAPLFQILFFYFFLNLRRKVRSRRTKLGPLPPSFSSSLAGLARHTRLGLINNFSYIPTRLLRGSTSEFLPPHAQWCRHRRRGETRRRPPSPGPAAAIRCGSRIGADRSLHHSPGTPLPPPLRAELLGSSVASPFPPSITSLFRRGRPKSIAIGMGNLSFGWSPGDLPVACLVRGLAQAARPGPGSRNRSPGGWLPCSTRQQ
jgi:hypothetical protein